MIFSLEALRARHGDSLLLHFGTPDKPDVVLIDGGPGGVYGDTLKPRLQAMLDGLRAMGRVGDEDALPLRLMMVSHIDDDHIGGLLGLTAELIDEKPTREPWVKPRSLWHNAFDDLAADSEGPREIDASPQPAKDATAVIASVGQGRRLRDDAESLDWSINEPFDGLVQAPEHGGQSVRLDTDTTLLVVSPRTDQIARLRKEWAEQLRKLKKKEASPAEVAEYLDESPYNLSSIVCLARQGERRMLLTGDARGGDGRRQAARGRPEAAAPRLDPQRRGRLLRADHGGPLCDLGERSGWQSRGSDTRADRSRPQEGEVHDPPDLRRGRRRAPRPSVRRPGQAGGEEPELHHALPPRRRPLDEDRSRRRAPGLRGREMAAIDDLQAQANALLGSAASPGVAVTQALVEDDPGEPFSPFVPAQAREAVEVADRLAEAADEVGGEAGVEAALELARELTKEHPPQLVQHALHLFIVHHPEGSRLSVPAIEPVSADDEAAVVTADLEETRREAA